ncbi:choice-of-anchor Q domain-containing protein [Spirosoma linguale]|uniref:Polymorphic outer membrane protein n=1 Tax=Spirosoma linguale (strain ATCC 33905 / DSM 74 / LMG 10896 / Claus 1) TaxID=504472 RepID=D2QB97_SPILD|nr:polymorphic outer membrane protein [Spirosoma linguale DSM 74]
MVKTSTLLNKALLCRLLATCLWLLTPVYLWGQTVYVTPAGAGQQTGADWANALPGSALQAQLASASAGTVFRLAGGLYKPTMTSDRSISFSIPSGVQVYGGYVGSGSTPDQRVDFATSDQPSSTTLSGDIDNDNQLDADNTNNVVRFSKVNEQTRLDGVVVAGGYANQPLANPELFNSFIGGGGIYNDAYRGTSSPTLENCSLSGNYSSGKGGGLFNDNRSGSANLKLLNTDFINNSAALGGAIYQYVSSPSGDFIPFFTNCRFVGNSAGSGGAVYTDVTIEFSGSPTLTSTYINCSFVGNTATSRGGAMYNDARGTTSLQTLSTLINCTLSDNTAPVGGAFLNTATPLFTRFVLVVSQVNLTNCILWNNGGTNAVVNETYSPPSGVTSGGQGRTVSTTSVLEAGVVLTSGSANQFITVSPFVSEGSLQLSPCSPAVNTGLNSAYTSANGPATDLAGNPRLFPAGGTIDAGAYELQQTSATPIAITQQPVSQSSVQAGATVVVTVGLSGPATSYAWYKDGVLVTGQESATLTLTNVQPIQSGSYQLVAVTPCNSVTSSGFSLVVTPMVSNPLVSSLTATILSLCAGSQTQLTAQASGGTATYTYSWYFTGDAILSNAVNNTIQLRANTAQVLSVSVVVTDATGATSSASLAITINSLPNASFTGLPASLCQEAAPVNLTASTPGGSFAGVGVEGSTFYPGRIQAGGPYTITYSVTSQGCSSTSTQSISVLSAPAAPSLVTLNGQLYAGNQSRAEVPQYSGTVTLVSSGCSGGTIS